MTDLRYCLAVARRMSVLEWAHGAACMAGLSVLTLAVLIGGA